MAIIKKTLSVSDIQTSKDHPVQTSEPSKEFQKKRLKNSNLSIPSGSQNSESQMENNKVEKPEKKRNSRVNVEKQATSQINSISGSQRSISYGGAANGNCRNLKKLQKNAVHIDVKRRGIRASNKHTMTIDNIMNIPNATNTTYTRQEASNDNGLNESLLHKNVITLSKQGVLLPQENSNLPVSETVKAVVKIDRLSMTIDVPPYQYDAVLEAVKDLGKADKNGLHLTKQQNKHGSRYSLNYKINDGDKNLGFLSVEPLKRTDRFLRLDFNPSKIKRSGCKIVAQAMRSIIGMNATEVINEANITRLDIAVDLHDIDINNMLYFSARPIEACTFGKIFKHGREVQYHYRLETQVIGATSSDYNFVVYDKRAERIARKGVKNDPGHEIVRVELRIKPRHVKSTLPNSKCSVKFDNLESMDNLFKKLIITGIPVPDKADGQFALFVYAAQHTGAHTALALVKNPRKRAEYRLRLLGQAVSSWKPDEYWSRAIDAVKKTLASIS